MTYLVVTDSGLQGTRRAEEGGFKLNITEFAVTEEQNVSLTVGDTALQGPEVYRSEIETVEAVGISTVKFTLKIPSAYPPSRSWMLREIGLFLDTGELFAHGTLPAAMQKTGEFGILFYVFVTVGRLGEVINVAFSSVTSLPSVPHVRSLLHPNDSKQNVLVVLDEQTGDDEQSSAGLAIKYGTGSLNWGFVGHKRQVVDYPTSVFSQGSFFYDVEQQGGFWLNDADIVIVQIVAGPGQGESRKMKFTKKSNVFTTVDKNFSSLASASKIAIWKDDSTQLPTRYSNFPEYLVLGVGKNTWVPDVVTLTAGSLYAYRYSAAVTGNLFNTGIAIPVSAYNDTTKFMIFVDGTLLRQNQYTAVGGAITTTVSATKSIDVVAFEFIQDKGSSLYFYEAIYIGDGFTVEFQMPILPDSSNDLLVFVDQKLIPITEYVINGSSVVFNNYAPTGRVVLVPFAQYEEQGTRSSMIRDTFTAVGGEVEFSTSSVFGLRKDTLMLVNGLYIEKDNYTVNANRIMLTGNLVIPPAAIVEVINFTGQFENVVSQPSGTNTGPTWLDPAGVVGKPNKIVPKVFTYHGDGVKKTFDIAEVPDAFHIFVFIHGVFQHPDSFYYSSLAIRFETPVPNSYPIDIICWCSELHSGTQVQCKYTSLIMNVNSLVYTVHNVLNIDSLIVSINGIYQHRSTYLLANNNTLTISEVIQGDILEVWSFDWEAKSGYMTTITMESQSLTTNKSYLLQNQVLTTADTLVFVGGAQLHKAGRYSVVNGDGISTIQLTNAPFNYQQSLPLFLVEFFSSKPSSRLMTREEVEAFYMPLRGPHVSWDNLTDKLKAIMACPFLKLLGLLTGTIASELNNPNLTGDDKSVTSKWGFVPVKMYLDEDIIPILNYAAIGSSVMLGIPVEFNFYDLLAKHIRTELGVTDFSIRNVEKGKKYIIDDIKISNVTFDAKTRANMPGAPLDTAWVCGAIQGVGWINTTHKDVSGNYASLVMLSTDAEWWCGNVGILGTPIGVPAMSTVSITSVDDSTYRRFTHVINYEGVNYTVQLARLLVVVNHNAQFLVSIATGGAPLIVQLFARVYASLKYNDRDCNLVVYCMNRTTTSYGNAIPCCEGYQWVDFSNRCREGGFSPPGQQYPASAGYTAGLAYGVKVYDADYTLGKAKVVVFLTSGSIGYSQFGVDLMLNAVKLPTNYTVYPGVHVKDDGTVEPVMDNKDLFESCCWRGINTTLSPDCTSETPALPVAGTPPPSVQLSPASVSATDHLYITVIDAKPGAIIAWESSDAPNQIQNIGLADNSGYFSYTTIPAGAPRELVYKVYIAGVYLDTVSITVTSAGGTAITHGSVEFVVSGSFTVPLNVFSMHVEELGAGGAGAGGDHTYGGTGGSRGQYVTSTVSVIPGEILDVTIGQGGYAGLGCIVDPDVSNNGTSGTSTILKRQDGTNLLIASGGIGGIAAAHFGSGTVGQSSELGIGGPLGNAGRATYDPDTGVLTAYIPASNGVNAGGYGAGGGGGGASGRDIADAIPGSAGGLGSKGWLRLTY